MRRIFRLILVLLIGLFLSTGAFGFPKTKAATNVVHLNNSIAKPYYLNQPNTNYILDEDILAEGTAFAIAADSVTVDLNGHTVTFGKTDISLPNFDFENSNAGSPSNWDLSLAPHASRVSTSEWPMVGNWAMKFTTPVAGEDIVSDWINITNPNRTYQAYALSSAGKSLLVKVDYNDGQTIRTINPDYNNSQVDTTTIAFKPSGLGWGAGQYRLHLTLNPVVTPKTFYVDYGDIRPAWDIGFNGYPYAWQVPDLPTVPGKHNNTIIKNGAVVEGNAGFRFYAVTYSGSNLEVAQTFAKTTGADSGIANSYSSATGQNFHDNTFENPKVYVVNRMDLSNYGITAGGNLSFYNNKFSFGGGGINLPNYGSNANIYNNIFTNSSLMTNHYSVTSYASGGHRIYNNNFLGGSSILLSTGSPNNEINNNFFNLTSEPCNTEYQTQLYTTGIRTYDYYQPTASTYNNRIHDNLIEGKTGYFPQFPACTPGIVGIKTATGVLSPNEFYRNEVHVYREDTQSEAIAFSALATNLSGIHDNYLESNHYNIIYGDKFASVADNGIFTNNTIVRRTNPISDGYYPTSPWWCCSTGAYSNHQYIGSKTIGANLLDIGDSIGAQHGTLEHDYRYFLDLKIIDSNKQGVEGANVLIKDKNGQQVFSGASDVQGKISDIDLRDLIKTFNMDTNATTSTPSTPHQITITKNGLPNEIKTLTIDSNKTLTISIDGQDNDPAIISNTAVEINRAGKTATVSWTTDQATTSQLDWGTTESYGKTLTDATLATNHSLSITNISPGDYHFKVGGINSRQQDSESFDETFFYLTSDVLSPTIYKNVDKSNAYPGDTITYTLIYKNITNNTISNARIEDNIPSRTTFLSAANGGTSDGTKVTWNLGDITAGASATVSFQVRIN